MKHPFGVIQMAMQVRLYVFQTMLNGALHYVSIRASSRKAADLRLARYYKANNLPKLWVLHEVQYEKQHDVFSA